MKTFYITIDVLALAALALAQSSGPAAAPGGRVLPWLF
jgi:hypothetical protein